MQGSVPWIHGTFFAGLLLLAAASDVSGQQRTPVPNKEAQAQAKQMAAEIYGNRFSEANNADEKTALAAEMIDAALQVRDGLPGQFVLLSIARDVAVAGGDAATALRAVDELARRFEVAAARLQGQTLLDAAREASATAQRKMIAQSGLAIVDALAAAGEYELAYDVCNAAHAAATRGREYTLARGLAAKEAELKALDKKSRDYRDALLVLDDNPLDPQANLTAGRHLCFVEGDWDWGVPMLALGSDAALKAIAARDLRGASSVVEQVALGDLWWELAEGCSSIEREAMQLRAGTWYRQAQPSLAGDLAGLKVKQRLAKIANLDQEIPATRQGPVLASAPFDAQAAGQFQLLWARHLRVPVLQTNSIGMRLVLLPPGEFMMGSTEEEVGQMVQRFRQEGSHGWVLDRIPAEAPRHRVRITRPFYLGMCEVTQAEYQRVMGVDAARFQGSVNLPAGGITWHEAEDFCRKLSELPDEKVARAVYQLPTEAQWEYACRAGSSTQYCFGNDPKLLRAFAQTTGNANLKRQPVGQKRPNAWSLLDMHGNVWEWCSDLYAPDYYAHCPVDDPTGPGSGNHRVLRGGSCTVAADGCRSTFRFNDVPDTKRNDFGFRVVRLIGD